jgi:hypothetical protein
MKKMAEPQHRSRPAVRARARCRRHPSIRLPPGKRIPGGWTASPAGADEAAFKLEWEEAEAAELLAALSRRDSREGEPYIRLRLTIALDYRDEQLVEARLIETGERLGVIDVRYAYAFQTFELPLDESRARAALRHGVALHHRGTAAQLWWLDDRNGGEDREPFVPHLLYAELPSGAAEAEAAALDCLLSLRSLQPFGWIEGCVLDGVHALAERAPSPLRERARAALDLHFGQYLTPDGRLVYEDLHGNAADGAFTTIEATLPVAVAAKLDPRHPLIPQAIAFFSAKAGADGLVIDDDVVSAEGCYTVAYPLAVIAAASGSAETAEQALRQALLRKRHLRGENSVHLRRFTSSGEVAFTNWSRAYGWYSLGLTKTYLTLRDCEAALPEAEMAELRGEIADALALARSYLPDSGVWPVFFGHSDSGPETSGTAAVAAAFALAAEAGVVPDSFREDAERIRAALRGWLTPDGLYGGVSQHNAGGMRLQLSGYRVLSQMGLGLWGQLFATLSYPRSHSHFAS